MTTSIRRINRPASAAPCSRPSLQAFTLTEVMIAATLSVLVLTGVLSAFLFIGRSGYLASGYSELSAQTRRALDTFGNEVRKSCDIHWNSAQSVTLTIVTSGNLTYLATYAYDATTNGATSGCFYRVEGDATSTSPRQILLRNVTSDFAFQRFKLEQPGVADNTATTDLETKQLQVTLRATRAGITTTTASQSALSASYILRNKRVAN